MSASPHRPALGVPWIACLLLCGCSGDRDGTGQSADDTSSELDSESQAGSGASDDEVDTAGSGGSLAEGTVTDDTPDDAVTDTLINDEDDEGTGVPNSKECFREVYEGEPVDTNLYFLMDVSGSMRSPLSLETEADILGPTVWNAVSGATQDFIMSTGAAGLNMALNVFPVKDRQTTACTQAEACTYFAGTPDEVDVACVTEICIGALLFGGTVIPCQALADCCLGFTGDDLDACLSNELCERPAQCSNGGTRECLADQHCLEGSSCVLDEVAPFSGICPGLPSCEASDYMTPLLARGPVAAVRDEAVTLLEAVSPDGLGNTPTHLGLAGAYSHVRQWQQADPKAESVVVVVSDGLPNGCDQPATGELCSIGSACQQSLDLMRNASSSGLRTYVIGVLSEGNTPAADVFTSMAEAGDTDVPFIVTTDGTTASNFLEALNVIRGELPCEFALPEPDTGSVDFNLVNVEVSQETGDPVVLPHVESAAECGADGIGWYYGNNDAGQFEKIELCAQSCADVTSSSTVQVDIVLGCPQLTKIK